MSFLLLSCIIVKQSKTEKMKTEKNNRISKITKEYLQNRYSEGTEKDIQHYLIEEENSEEQEKASLEYWEMLETEPNSRTYQLLKRINSKIGVSKTIPLHRRLMRIAAILIPTLIILGGVYYFTRQEKMIQVIAAYGETKHVILPDSSEVWLNAGSSIDYPSSFKQVNRLLKLDGEAYFSIRKDEEKPFIVNTQNLSVRVLGTKFNVKAYSNDSRTVATLTSGKVEVKTNSDQTRILEPDQQFIFDNKTGSIDVARVSADDMMAWTTGQLVFSDATLNDIFQTLERRFDLSFDVSKSSYKSEEHYTVKFLKNDSIEHILNVLKDMAGDFTYFKTNNKITLLPNK